MGLVIGEQNRPSTFYIYPNTGNNKIENILINIKGPYNTFGSYNISDSISSDNINALAKFRKDTLKEQKKLEYKSVAQKSFFRAVSFDIGPIVNLMTNKKNTGEIAVNVELEDDRVKITFLPKFSGIYELLLTHDGQHLQGSPFITRIMKNSKDVEDTLKTKSKTGKSKIERKVINKSIDFINESVDVTDEFDLKLDSNNNTNNKDLSESNRSDDESTYQDSGIFDLNDQCSNRSRQNDLEDIDEDSQFAESSVTDESNQNSLDCKIGEEANVSDLIEIDNESHGDGKKIIIHNRMPDDVTFLTQEMEQQTEQMQEENIQEQNVIAEDCISDTVSAISEDNNAGLEDEIFDNADLQNNQEFENLYNKYTDNENQNQNKIINVQNDDSTINNINGTDFEILSNIPQFQRGKKVTSSIEKIVEIFEKDPSNKNAKDKVHVTVAEKIIIKKSDFTHASPVLTNIAQEAANNKKVPSEDSVHLKGDIQLSSKDKRPILRKDSSICLEDDEIYDTNVKEIKSIFEKRSDVQNRRFVSNFKKQNALQDSKKMLAKSLPNLICDPEKGSMEDPYRDDEFLIRFKEKKNFWNNLILQNSNSSLNVSASEINDDNTNLKLKQYENISQSSNGLNTFSKGSKTLPLNKFKRKKNELCKTASLDLTKTYQDIDGEERVCKITRAESLYDRIRLFEKGKRNFFYITQIIKKMYDYFTDFDTGKHSNLLKRTKERSDLREKPKHAEIIKPDSLTEVPNTNSTNQIEEDIRFAEIMKERFEISKRYFSSLESLHVKPNLNRRHSMDSRASDPKEVPLKKGGSLKVLNVMDKFSLDNIYKDVVLNKIRNSNFMGTPNKDAVMETLSSVSSCENECDRGKNNVEEEDLNLQFFNIKKRLRKRRSIKSIFDVNY